MKDRRVLLFLVMLATFAVWLGAVVYIFLVSLNYLDNLSPVLTLTAGLGIGAVTQFFILVLKDAWQFFYRKSGPKPENK